MKLNPVRECYSITKNNTIIRLFMPFANEKLDDKTGGGISALLHSKGRQGTHCWDHFAGNMLQQVV